MILGIYPTSMSGVMEMKLLVRIFNYFRIIEINLAGYGVGSFLYRY